MIEYITLKWTKNQTYFKDVPSTIPMVTLDYHTTEKDFLCIVCGKLATTHILTKGKYRMCDEGFPVKE